MVRKSLGQIMTNIKQLHCNTTETKIVCSKTNCIGERDQLHFLLSINKIALLYPQGITIFEQMGEINM